MWKRSIAVAASFVGIVVGAGFASGMEALQYFVAYGTQGFWGVLLAGVTMLVAVAVMVAVLLGLLQVMPAWAEGEMLVRLLRLGALVAAGLVAYFGMLLILGFRPRDFARRAL